MHVYHCFIGMHLYEGYTAIKNSGGQAIFEGNAPVFKMDEEQNIYKLPYCYYAPTEKGFWLFLSSKINKIYITCCMRLNSKI